MGNADLSFIFDKGFWLSQHFSEFPVGYKIEAFSLDYRVDLIPSWLSEGWLGLEMSFELLYDRCFYRILKTNTLN